MSGDPVQYAHIPVLIAAAATTAACVILHYEGLHALLRWLVRKTVPARLAIIGVVTGLLMLHLVEITLYAGVLNGLVQVYDERAGHVRFHDAA